MTTTSQDNQFYSPEANSNRPAKSATPNGYAMTWWLPVSSSLAVLLGFVFAMTPGGEVLVFLCLSASVLLFMAGIVATLSCLAMALYFNRGSWHLVLGVFTNLLLTLLMVLYVIF